MTEENLKRAASRVKPELTQERLKELFLYIPSTGAWWCQKTTKMRRAGDPVSMSKGNRGHPQIWADNKPYSAARLCWFYVTGEWPDHPIRFKNGDVTDLAWENLECERVEPVNGEAELTQERIKELLHYDPESGIFRWNTSRQGCGAGKVAGCLDSQGYIALTIDYWQFRASRVAWCYMTGQWPENMVDHENRDRADNSWSNLREATHTQNQWNKVKPLNSTNPYKGVSYDRNPNYKHKPWKTSIGVNGKRIHLGHYSTAEEARDIRNEASKKYHGQFAKIE